VPLEEAPAVSPGPTRDLAALDDALPALSRLDPRRGRVVELRFFGRLNMGEAAAVLSVSPEAVKRNLRVAKRWLAQELSGERPHGFGTMAANRRVG
jgi:DNA-directed RNA polymerase specialized sigma24 family protein